MADQTFTAAELAKCAERELGQRRYVYPRRVEEGRMKQPVADKELAMMEQIAREYRAKADAEAKAGRLI